MLLLDTVKCKDKFNYERNTLTPSQYLVDNRKFHRNDIKKNSELNNFTVTFQRRNVVNVLLNDSYTYIIYLIMQDLICSVSKYP